jgi:hypothetical protein
MDERANAGRLALRYARVFARTRAMTRETLRQAVVLRELNKSVPFAFVILTAFLMSFA